MVKQHEARRDRGTSCAVQQATFLLRSVALTKDGREAGEWVDDNREGSTVWWKCTRAHSESVLFVDCEGQRSTDVPRFDGDVSGNHNGKVCGGDSDKV